MEALDGEFLAILGAPGAGKTTLLNILAGFDQPTQGVVKVFGRNPVLHSRMAADQWHTHTIGYVPQKRVWLTRLPVLDHLELQLLRTVGSRAERLERAMDTLAQFRISRLAGLLPEELTVSEQLRVAVARAFVAGPKLLLVDELGAGCDLETMMNLLRELQRVNQRNGTTVIVTGSDPCIARFAVTTKMLVDGRIGPYQPIPEPAHEGGCAR